MALISDQALIRHQYQRRMKTRPVPAPSPINSFHPCSTLLRYAMTPSDASIRTTVAIREATTCARRPACGLMNRR
jgi:hypothetical protein